MSWIPSVAVVAILPLVFVVYRKVFPYRPSPGEPPITLEQARALFRKYWWVNLVLFVVIVAWGIGFTWGWTRLLIVIDNWCLARLPPGRYLIKPGFVIWMLPGLFLGIITAALPYDIICRLALRKDYAEYMRFERFSQGFDGKKAFIAMAVPLLVASALFTGLACDWYLQVTDDYIAWNPFWSLAERRYNFSEVERLIEIPEQHSANGNVNHFQRHFIVFTDGSVWRSEEMGSAWDSYSYEHEMLKFVERQTGKSIIHAESLEGLVP